MKLSVIIAINCLVIIVNFSDRFDKALMEIFQFSRALVSGSSIFAGVMREKPQMEVFCKRDSLKTNPNFHPTPSNIN
jgi:hypothetical protein